jgi:hypothetical protein
VLQAPHSAHVLAPVTGFGGQYERARARERERDRERAREREERREGGGWCGGGRERD